MAARAFGAKHTYFATNGTSTCNKIVVQALVRPGDIVLLSTSPAAAPRVHAVPLPPSPLASALAAGAGMASSVASSHIRLYRARRLEEAGVVNSRYIRNKTGSWEGLPLCGPCLYPAFDAAARQRGAARVNVTRAYRKNKSPFP